MRMRLTRDVEQEDDRRRKLTAEVFVHERRGGGAELQPAGAEWRVRWLRGTADLNRQGSGSATVRVTAPGLYRVRRVASSRRARDAYVEVSDAEGPSTPPSSGWTSRCRARQGPCSRPWKIDSASPRPEPRAAQRRDAADALADQLEAGYVHTVLPHVVLTVDGLEVPPLNAVSDKQLTYARAVRASAVHRFLSLMLARGAKLPRSNVEEEMPMLAGWLQNHLRAESHYWLGG
ncbi:hypothetical protein ACJ2CR_19345 [Myxococcus faecalis]|uniref:hypothetical protein n=1 Tax=Myxococcus faecalis TaxID=3115646 RepID=UPI0038D20441